MTIVRVKDGQSLTLDAVTRESHTMEVQLPEHPIESGATVTDHAQVMPIASSVDGIVTESPLAVVGGTAGSRRCLDAADFLTSSAGQLLYVRFDRVGNVPSMMIKNLSYDFDAKTRRMAVRLQFKRIRRADAVSVDIPAKRPPARTAPKVVTEQDGGVQQPVPTDAPAGANSSAWRLARAVGAV